MLSRCAIRNASSHASRASGASAQRVAEQQTKVPSGLTVASYDNHGPIAHFVLAFRAGSRYEGVSERGIVHHLRNSVGRDSKKYGGVQLIWSAGSVGAEVDAFANQDVLGVRVSVPRDHTSLALSVLGHIAGDPALKPWEVEEVLPSLRTDLSLRRAEDIVFADILRAAYRNGALANPVLGTKHQIGRHSFDSLQRFAEKHLVARQAVLYGVNVEHERVVNYAENHAPLAEGAGASPAASPYKGGDWRREASGSVAHVVIAGPGASASDASALATQAVLTASLGHGPSTKLSGGAGHGWLASHLKGTNVAVASFESTFEGEGIVGAYLVADASRAHEATRAVARALKIYAPDDLEAAKIRARHALIRASENSAGNAVTRAIATLAGVKDGAVLDAIQNVTGAQVEAAAKKLSANLSVAAYGDISTVPYRDEL